MVSYFALSLPQFLQWALADMLVTVYLHAMIPIFLLPLV